MKRSGNWNLSNHDTARNRGTRFLYKQNLHPKLINAKICTASYFFNMYNEIWQLCSLLFFRENITRRWTHLRENELEEGMTLISNRRTLFLNCGKVTQNATSDAMSHDLKLPRHWVVQSYCCYKDSLMEVLETSPLKGSLSCFWFYQLSSPAAFSKLPSVRFCNLCYQPNYSEREISCASAFVQMRVASFIK